MQNIIFTDEGFIFPNEKINVDLATLKTVFVDNFPNSTTRKTLYDNYLRYTDDFSKQITPNFTQWINGSFVTLKENPNDIDFVTFIKRAEYQKIEADIDKYWSFSLEKQGLDAYIVQIYEEHTEKYVSRTLKHTNDWSQRYSNTKPDDNLETFKKGFLEIIF